MGAEPPTDGLGHRLAAIIRTNRAPMVGIGPLMEMNMSDLEDHTQQPEIDARRATARLPGLDIEIVHRRSPGGDAEQISINLQAVPSFEAFGRFVESASAFAFWAQAMQMAWLPWRAAAQAMLRPGLTLPQVGSEGTTRSRRQ